MQDDYEPILERQIHHLINYAQGIMHIGQRDIAWLRVSKQAVEKGFKLQHIGVILHAKLHQDFGRIFDKLQVKLYTDRSRVKEIVEKARKVYVTRDQRIEGMTDEIDRYLLFLHAVPVLRSQPCLLSSARKGRASAALITGWTARPLSKSTPPAPTSLCPRANFIDAKLGQWKGVNEFISKASRGKIDHYNFYSIVNDPMTTCGCCEAIAAVLPDLQRHYDGQPRLYRHTPCGMKFTTLAGTIGGGLSTPGFVGHGKYNITQRKFVAGEGGLLRMVWMPKCFQGRNRRALQETRRGAGRARFARQRR